MGSDWFLLFFLADRVCFCPHPERHWNCGWSNVQGAGGGLQSGPGEEWWGLPHAEHSHIPQLIPPDWPQGTAEPCSHNSSHSGKVQVRKGKMLHSQWGVRGGGEKQPCRHQSQKRRCSRCPNRGSLCRRSQWSRHPHCSPWEGPHFGKYISLKEPWSLESPCWSRFILKCCSPWEGATPQKRTRMQRGDVKDLPQPPFPALLGSQEGESEVEHVKRRDFKFCFFFLLVLYFNGE